MKLNIWIGRCNGNMKFKKKGYEYKLGKIFGYIAMFFVFSILLYFILFFFNKIPKSWNYTHIFMVALFLILIGRGIKWWLEQ